MRYRSIGGVDIKSFLDYIDVVEFCKWDFERALCFYFFREKIREKI